MASVGMEWIARRRAAVVSWKRKYSDLDLWLQDYADLYTAFVIFVEIWLLYRLYRYMIPHTLTYFVPFFEPADASTRTAAIISSAAALLLSGVILMAPLLSLSLHQSYDTLFELRKYLLERAVSGANHTDLIDRVEGRLSDQLHWYRWLNPPYLGTWVTSVAVLAFVAVYSVLNRWGERDMFYDALFFMLASCILSVIFSCVSIIFFIITRPGITKLDLFISYFNDEEKNKKTQAEAAVQPIA
jgi:hypothetical protein